MRASILAAAALAVGFGMTVHAGQAADEKAPAMFKVKFDSTAGPVRRSKCIAPGRPTPPITSTPS